MKGIQMRKTIEKVATAIMNPEFRARTNFVRPPFIFWGPKGSGKTYVTNSAATSIHIPAINIRLGQEMSEDMSYPDVKTINETKILGKVIAEQFPRYATNKSGDRVLRRKVIDGEVVDCVGEFQIDFTLAKDYIENWDEVSAYYEKQGLTINDAPGAIIFLDEINRIEDKSMFQMIFQLFDSGKFKGYTAPEEMTFIGAANPTGGSYIVNDWFADIAFANRCIHLKTEYDFNTWLEYATKDGSGYDDVTIEFYKSFPGVLFNVEENNFKVPETTSSYRNASFLSLYVMGIDYEDVVIKNEMLAAIVGNLNVGNFNSVEEELHQALPTPEQILFEYDAYDAGDNPIRKRDIGSNNEGASVYKQIAGPTLVSNFENQPVDSIVRQKVLNLIEENKSSAYYELDQSVVKYIYDNINDEKFAEDFSDNLLRFTRFLFDLPAGRIAVVMRGMMSPEAFEDEKHFDKETEKRSSKVSKALMKGEQGTIFKLLCTYNHEKTSMGVS